MLKECLLATMFLVPAIKSYDECDHCAPTNYLYIDSFSTTPYSQENHPIAQGMNYWGGYDRCKAGDKESGYYYYDVNIYSEYFTDISKIFLINVKVDFTSGFIACQNNMSGYSNMFDLDRGYVHLAAVNRFIDNYDIASSVKMLASWPSSSKSTSSVSSAYSINYSSNWTNGMSFTWPNGVQVSAQNTSGFSLQIDHSTTIMTDEPYVSTQTSPSNALEQQWNYQYKDLGKTTYTLDTFYLLEVKNDAVGFNTYGFVFDIYLNMSNVQWKGWWWESHDSQNYSMRLYIGLGRNPGEEK